MAIEIVDFPIKDGDFPIKDGMYGWYHMGCMDDIIWPLWDYMYMGLYVCLT